MQNRQQAALFWPQVEETCETLYADIYLPPDIEAHLQRTFPGNDQLPSYNSQLHQSLRSVEHLFQPEGDACQAEHAFQVLDTQLEAVEDQLLSLISCLEKSSAAIQRSANHRIELKCNAIVAADEARHISEFVNKLVLPGTIQTAIKSSNPHSKEFKHALDALSQALASCELHENTPSVQEVSQSLMSLRDIAIRRIDERLGESLRLMKDPASSFEILRDTLLLKQKAILNFLRCHRPALFKSFTKEYVHTAKLAFRAHVRSYYSLLAPCVSSSDAVADRLQSIGSRTSKMLSSVWNFVSAASKVPHTGEESEGAGIQGSSEDANEMEEGLKLLSNQCADAMRNCQSPPLTSTDVQLQGNSFRLPLNLLIRELVASFLSYEGKESQFLAALFNGDGYIFLCDIFSDKDNPVLSCLEESIQHSDSRSEAEELCLSLYICRRIRESITTQQEIDHRVSLFVLLERIIQTRFHTVLDLKVKGVKEFWLQQSSHDVVDTPAVREMTQFAALVTNLLVIAQQGDRWIHSRDVGYALMRRLNACINTFLVIPEPIYSPGPNADWQMKAYLRCSSSLLIVLDVFQSLEPHDHSTDDFRKLVEKFFCCGCSTYARVFAEHRLKEINQLEDAGLMLSMDEAKTQLSVLSNKLSRTEGMIKTGLKFLTSDSVEDVYERKAVKLVLKSLHLRTEALKQTLSVRHSDLSHMLHW